MLTKLRYTLNSGKNSKLLYFIKGYLRWLTPSFLRPRYSTRLWTIIEQREDAEYIMQRIEYYNHMPTGMLPSNLPSLGAHRPARQKVYFFDTFEFTRFFPDTLRWSFLPGDTIHVPKLPTIVKSRPLHVHDDACSVIMKLDKVRHFTFIKDHKPWEEKLNKVIFRGKVLSKAIRQRFMELYHSHPMCDAADVSRAPNQATWSGEKLTLRQHLDYKFIMALEGNDVASNLKWIMSSGSIAVMPRPSCETWFMEGTLIPNYHYIEIKEDLSDLIERIEYYIEHPDEAKAIVRHANEYVSQFMNNDRESLISLGVLQRYFERSRQI